MSISVFDEFRDLARALREEGVDYATVGAVALAMHGAPRATTDIDLLIDPPALEAALAVARKRGFTVEALPMRFSDGMEVQRVSKFEGEDFLCLDFLLVDHNLRPIWEARSDIMTKDGPVRVVSRKDLIAMKAAAARHQDLADIQRLQELDR